MENKEPPTSISLDDFLSAEYQEGSDDGPIFHPPEQILVSREHVLEVTGKMPKRGQYTLKDGREICVL